MYDIIDIKFKSIKDEKALYKETHYKKIEIISVIFNKFINKFSDLKFLINHQVYLNSQNKEYTLYRNFELLAYNEKEIIICYIKPQFNTINYNEVLLQSIFDTFIIKNVQKMDEDDNKLSDNYKRFNNKKIITCVFTLDNNNKPYYIDWSDKDNNDLIKKNNILIKNIIKTNLLLNFKLYNNDIYYFYKYWYNKNKNQSSYDIINKIIEEYHNYKKNIKT